MSNLAENKLKKKFRKKVANFRQQIMLVLGRRHEPIDRSCCSIDHSCCSIDRVALLTVRVALLTVRVALLTIRVALLTVLLC
jgi:hypothetical protein